MTTSMMVANTELELILLLTDHGHTSCLMHLFPNWNSLQPPKAESLNGLLLGYRIYYRELEYESSGPESKTIKTPSALRTELTRE